MTPLSPLELYKQRKAASAAGVNPPEAAQVLATQTGPETEARPVAAPAAEPAPPATAAPSAETGSTASPSPAAEEPAKKTRGRRAASSTAAPAAGESAPRLGTDLELLEALRQLQRAVPEGVTIAITVTGRE